MTLPAALMARQAQVVAVVARHAGNRQTAATELGVAYQSVDRMLEAVAAKGLIPPDLAPLLPGRMRASHNVPAEAGEA